MKTTAWRVCALVVGMAVVAGACGAKSSDSEGAAPVSADLTEQATPVDGGTITWGLEAETDGLNPISGRFAMSGHMMASAIFDPLATIDENGAGRALPRRVARRRTTTTRVWTITSATRRACSTTARRSPPRSWRTPTGCTRTSAITSRAVADIATIEVTGPLHGDVSP